MIDDRHVPTWLEELAQAAAECIVSTDLSSPIGCHYRENQLADEWEVTLFLAKTEIVGGPGDGKKTDSNFWVDLAMLQPLMEDITAFGWQALPMGEDDEAGPHVAMSGNYQGHQVWLRILSTAPDRFEAGRKADVLAGRFVDLW
ncbi:hypothetical protein V22_01530 [Calycomorphotria hydatis]|uniref:Uncharacterized protein n=2 Tax=Calycomorphotria hydatis TaxID=2528027 RepID=A0A517T3K8_9PLAN|nr:hypothetical protein V22_01530 [Calycomorphotria hydatis]